MEFLGTLLNVGSGGIAGLAGSVIGTVAKIFQAKQERAARKDEWQHELKLIEMQMQQAAGETENELKITTAATEAKIREGSYRLPVTVSNVSTWVNNIRALFRPFLTLTLDLAAVAVLLIIIWDLDGGRIAVALSSDSPIAELITYMVHSLFFTSSAATAWWFGDRALNPPHTRHV